MKACEMELFKMFNPMEWLKEIHKANICIRIVLLVVCIITLFFSDVVLGINFYVVKTVAMYLIPIVTVSIFGSLLQCWWDCKKCADKQIEEELAREKASKEKELKEKEETEKSLRKYYRQFDLCSKSERVILEKFYILQKTSIYIEYSEIDLVRVMNSKGIKFISARQHDLKGLAYTTPEGLAIITKYYDMQKEKFFDFLRTLQGRKKTLLSMFNVDNIMYPGKGYKATSFKLIDDFNNNGFTNIYWSQMNECLEISELYGYFIAEFHNQK